MTKTEKKPEFDLEFIKTYMALSAEEKLKYLEELNRFLAAATPEKSKKAWEELRLRGV